MVQVVKMINFVIGTSIVITKNNQLFHTKLPIATRPKYVKHLISDGFFGLAMTIPWQNFSV